MVTPLKASDNREMALNRTNILYVWRYNRVTAWKTRPRRNIAAMGAKSNIPRRGMTRLKGDNIGSVISWTTE